MGNKSRPKTDSRGTPPARGEALVQLIVPFTICGVLLAGVAAGLWLTLFDPREGAMDQGVKVLVATTSCAGVVIVAVMAVSGGKR